MFEKGHKFGYHNNHWRGGRLTKAQYERLKGLVPNSVEAWEVILKYDVSKERDKFKWYQLKSDVAGKVLSKFTPDLTEDISGEWTVRYDERAERFVAKSIGGAEGLQVITGREQANGTTGGV